jgi:hypothetical protein
MYVSLRMYFSHLVKGRCNFGSADLFSNLTKELMTVINHNFARLMN